MPEIMPWHQTQLRNPEFTRVDLVKEGANSQAHIKLFKHKEGDVMKFEELLSKMKPEHRAIVEEAIEKAKTDATADAEATIAELTKQKEDAEEALTIAKSASGESQATTEEDILKTVKDPAVRALLETQIAKTKAAEEAVRKHAADKLEAEAIEKAREVAAVGATEEQLAGIYKGLHDKPEVREEVFGILKAATALAKEGGVFTSVGKSAGAAETAGGKDNAWAQIEKAAEVHKSAGMSQAQAITKAINENPELYAAYVNA